MDRTYELVIDMSGHNTYVDGTLYDDDGCIVHDDSTDDDVSYRLELPSGEIVSILVTYDHGWTVSVEMPAGTKVDSSEAG